MPVAVKLFNDNNKVSMTSFNLKDDEIKSIFAYIKKAETEVEVAKGPVTGTPGATEENRQPGHGYYSLRLFFIY